VGNDPVELPHRYHRPRDIEVSALLSASLAYGRVELFKPKLVELLAQMGRSPAEYVAELDVPRARKLLAKFVYRFNVGADMAVLLLGMGRALRELGSLEALFVQCLQREDGRWREAMIGFGQWLRDVPMGPLRRALGKERGLHHLLPSGMGACKRWNLFLRWMVRGPDEIDFGIWDQLSPAQLIIPLDTHIHRMSLHLGLTRRRTMGWQTAEEITASLRLMDASDPVKYDFALCHYGMSGACPLKPTPVSCRACPLLGACRVGKRLLKATR
jgi:uncharacterized protein (TIGR02757 family)